MSKFGELFFGLILLFFGWIFMGNSSTEKLSRGCRPLAWMGNVFTSTAEISFPTTSAGVQDWFARLDYGCQYTFWRLFYEDEYKAKLKRDGKAVPGEGKKKQGPPDRPSKPGEPPRPIPPERDPDEAQQIEGDTGGPPTAPRNEDAEDDAG